MAYVIIIFAGIAILIPLLNAVLRKKYFLSLEEFARQIPARIQIECFDKKGTPCTLWVSPAIEATFTLSNGRKTTLYLDTVRLSPEGLTGTYSAFLNLKKTIPLNTIKKIRLQNSGKQFTGYAKESIG